jgi:peroxiredoxin Q/BCP
MKNLLSTFSILLMLGTASIAQNPKKTLAVGDMMPRFALADQDGKAFDVAGQIGKHALVIYFYPKDESMVCTKEACSFRDSFNDFTKAGALVIGINSGSVKSHHDFAANHKLPFILLSDPDDKVLKLFGVKGFMGMSGRVTFVVDLSGKIIYTYDSMMHGVAHSEKALAAVKAMKK